MGTDIDIMESDGGIFLSKKFPDKGLKRWFKTHLHLIDPTLEFFDFCRQLINQSGLTDKIAVPNIEERGGDWVLMDYDASAVSIREMKNHNDEGLHKLRAACEGINSTQSSYLLKMIERKSSFLRQSFASGKLIIAGLEIY